MKVVINSPYPLNTPKGNTVSAQRIEQLLNNAGHHAQAMSTATPPPADALIALHALKSKECILHFRKHNPMGKIITYLTGTDMYTDTNTALMHDEAVFAATDHFVISQNASSSSIPDVIKSKTQVIRMSVSIPEELPARPSIISEKTPCITLTAHLRKVKNPFLINRALALIPHADLQILTLGKHLEEGYDTKASEFEKADSRFRWLGMHDRPTTLSHVKHSSATLNTSFREGGSNSVIESLLLGTPVITSDIEGSRGQLGDSYDGFFPSDDHQALADLINRFLNDRDFNQHLNDQCAHLAKKFDLKVEQSDWLDILL